LLNVVRVFSLPDIFHYSHVPHNDIFGSSGLHIPQWFHKVIMELKISYYLHDCGAAITEHHSGAYGGAGVNKLTVQLVE
jgi:hypothetical protein